MKIVWKHVSRLEIEINIAIKLRFTYKIWQYQGWWYWPGNILRKPGRASFILDSESGSQLCVIMFCIILDYSLMLLCNAYHVKLRDWLTVIERSTYQSQQDLHWIRKDNTTGNPGENGGSNEIYIRFVI